MKKWKSLSRVPLYSSWNSPGQNTGVSSLLVLQGISPTQGLNSGLLDCRQILYQLSHKGSPRILQWVAYPFPSGLSHPRNWTAVSCTAGRFFANWAIREALMVRRGLYWFGSSFSFVIRSDSVVSLNPTCSWFQSNSNLLPFWKSEFKQTLKITTGWFSEHKIFIKKLNLMLHFSIFVTNKIHANSISKGKTHLKFYFVQYWR